MTSIKPCTCQHAMQDKMHGRGNRVHNACMPEGGKGGNRFKGARCTVCGNVKTVQLRDPKKDEGKGEKKGKKK